MRVIFVGTSAFAVPSLEALIASPHEVAAVVTQPDKPRGRGREMAEAPVKQVAGAHGIEVLQPAKLRTPESVQAIQDRGPVGALVVAAYGQKIPTVLLEWPRHGAVNVHGSILPKYRGAAPIQYALIMGESQTGVTTMLMDEGWDTGDILLQESLEIGEEENSGELAERLAMLGADLLIRTLGGLESGTISPMPQDDSLASYAPALSRDAGAIDWTVNSAGVVNRIRGCTPRPGAFTSVDGSLLKIWRARVEETREKLGAPGQVVAIDNTGIVLAAGGGSVRLLEVQPEARKRMGAADYARGAGLRVCGRLDERARLPGVSES